MNKLIVLVNKNFILLDKSDASVTRSTNMMSIYFNAISSFCVLLGVLLATVMVRAELEASPSNNDGKIQTTKSVVIRKCCKENEILVETNIGIRSCKIRSDYIEGKLAYRKFIDMS